MYLSNRPCPRYSVANVALPLAIPYSSFVFSGVLWIYPIITLRFSPLFASSNAYICAMFPETFLQCFLSLFGSMKRG